MMQKVNCTLSIFGLVNSSIFEAVRKYLETDLDALCSDIDNKDNFIADIEGIPGGNIPDALKNWLVTAKVNFRWEWGSSYDFCEGALMYDAVRGVMHEVNMTCGEVCVLASQLNDESAINAAAEAHAFRQENLFTQCVIFEADLDRTNPLAGLQDVWDFYGKDIQNG